MGCTSSNRILSEEERLIQTHEQRLGFNKSSTSRIDAVFRKFARVGQLNSNQFADAVVHLSLATEDSIPSSSLKEFYKKFQVGEDSYSFNELAVLGIMLGHGGFSEKARLLFEVNDVTGRRTLNSEQIRALIETLHEVICTRLPSLVTGPKQASIISQYTAKMQRDKARSISQLTSALSGASESVSLETFVKNLSGPQWQKLLATNGFRGHFYKAGLALHLKPDTVEGTEL